MINQRIGLGSNLQNVNDLIKENNHLLKHVATGSGKKKCKVIISLGFQYIVYIVFISEFYVML